MSIGGPELCFHKNGFKDFLGRYWFQWFFHIHPYLGKWSDFTNVFSNGLKPPTSVLKAKEKPRQRSMKSWLVVPIHHYPRDCYICLELVDFYSTCREICTPMDPYGVGILISCLNPNIKWPTKTSPLVVLNSLSYIWAVLKILVVYSIWWVTLPKYMGIITSRLDQDPYQMFNQNGMSAKGHWLLVSNNFYFHPDPWGNDSNFTSIFFKWVGEQPPTRST